jgi:hypothetical protein
MKIAFAVLSVVAFAAFATPNDMSRCLEHHSFDTCHHASNR